MTREVEVSHWGQVWLEEMYTLKHAGAKIIIIIIIVINIITIIFPNVQVPSWRVDSQDLTTQELSWKVPNELSIELVFT